MMIEVMCRIADGPLRPVELDIAEATEPLVSWSVITRDVPEPTDWRGKDLAIELHFPDNAVWTGEAYPVSEIEPDDQVPRQSSEQLQLCGIGALTEDLT